MTNNIAKIRAALAAAKTTARICVLPGLTQETEEAIAALAELEKAAREPRVWLAEPVAGDYASYIEMVARTPEKALANATGCYYAEFRAVPLYAVPPAPVAEIREPTPEECERIGKLWDSKATGLCRTGRDMFNAVRAVMWPKSEGQS